MYPVLFPRPVFSLHPHPENTPLPLGARHFQRHPELPRDAKERRAGRSLFFCSPAHQGVTLVRQEFNQCQVTCLPRKFFPCSMIATLKNLKHFWLIDRIVIQRSIVVGSSLGK